MKSIEIISIPVTDQQAAKDFYLKLGFEVLAEAPFDTHKWIQLGYKGQDVSITLVTWFESMVPGSVRGFVIKTDTLDQDIADLKGQGLDVGPVDQTPWGKFVAVKDPDGNVISLHGK